VSAAEMLEGQQSMHMQRVQSQPWLLPPEQAYEQSSAWTRAECAAVLSLCCALGAGVLTGLLNKYLGDFIEGLDAEQLKLGSETRRHTEVQIDRRQMQRRMSRADSKPLAAGVIFHCGGGGTHCSSFSLLAASHLRILCASVCLRFLVIQCVGW
jgi:hypothetical protein